MVAPITVSPAALVTGIGSPVTIDSSTAEVPSVTSPSTGIFSPGRTTTMSPGTTSSTGISASAPSRTTRAVRACKPDQLADRLAGAGLGPGLEQPAEQDQGEDHADRFEVHLAHVGGQQAGQTVTTRL